MTDVNSEPTVFYQQGDITIYHGNALDIIPHIKICDVLITDPPYGKNFKSGLANNHDKIIGDHSQEIALQVLKLVTTKFKKGRHAYVFGDFILSEPWASQCELIWDKEIIGPGNLTIPWGPQHEPIQFAVYVPSKANRKRGDGRLTARLRKGSVLRSPRKHSRGAMLHPMEKPVAILRQMIESSTMIGETVLDPFAGSGSTLEAALIEDRGAIGIEIEEKFCEIAANRIRQHSST